MFKTSNLRQSGLWEIDFLTVIYEVPSLKLFNFEGKKKAYEYVNCAGLEF